MELLVICAVIVVVIVFWVQQHYRNVYLKEISEVLKEVSKKMNKK